MVVFFASYSAMKLYLDAWRPAILAHLAACKAIFQEEPARGAASAASLDSLLSAYAAQARSSKGAVLMAVMGGKLSEGINFGDDLGRAVLVVGLPFPNPSDPILAEKLAFLTARKTMS